MSFLQNGFVVIKSGSRFQMQLIADGRVVSELEPSAKDKKTLKPGRYDPNMNYLGPDDDDDDTSVESSDGNPYHDPATGRFTTGSSGPGGETMTVFHGTGSQSLASIMKGGINPSKSQKHLGMKQGVFVSTSRAHAFHFASQNVGRNEKTGKMSKRVVLEIKVPVSEYRKGSPDRPGIAMGKKAHVIHRAIPAHWIVGGEVRR